MMERGEGERLLAARRRRFWGWLATLGLLGGIAGGISGFITGHEDIGMDAITALPLAAKYGIVGVLVAAFLAGCVGYYRAIDELEIMDNLWSSTASYYVFAILIPAWWLLWKMEAAPEPNVWVIFFAALAAGLGVYGWRKWQASR
jgi:hypothetical protein